MKVYTDEREAVTIYGLAACGRVPIRSGIFEERPGAYVHGVRCQHDRSIFDPCPECEGNDPHAAGARQLHADIDG